MAHPFAFGLASIIVASKLRRMVAQWEELIKQRSAWKIRCCLFVPSASSRHFLLLLPIFSIVVLSPGNRVSALKYTGSRVGGFLSRLGHVPGHYPVTDLPQQGLFGQLQVPRTVEN